MKTAKESETKTNGRGFSLGLFHPTPCSTFFRSRQVFNFRFFFRIFFFRIHRNPGGGGRNETKLKIPFKKFSLPEFFFLRRHLSRKINFGPKKTGSDIFFFQNPIQKLMFKKILLIKKNFFLTHRSKILIFLSALKLIEMFGSNQSSRSQEGRFFYR